MDLSATLDPAVGPPVGPFPTAVAPAAGLAADDLGPTEFAFTLPRGLVAADGTVHREGRMRLATALDEIEPIKDPRVRANPGYLVVILLARVITRLGTLDYVNTNVVENLYAVDLAHLQDTYQRINLTGDSRFQVACPHCAGEFEVETGAPGG